MSVKHHTQHAKRQQSEAHLECERGKEPDIPICSRNIFTLGLALPLMVIFSSTFSLSVLTGADARIP